ncbi:SDR family oxidoreductase [Massilia niastensis]|uniref:SDR family oxidoreductase n=1 Tax=Massilia niastensis TaxID=544911 RepID=UPI0003723400|nr:SDR family oxidoreductase [Massilia niastensis]
MSTLALTGCASGIGAATRTALLAAGHTIIGIDRHGADIDADLSNPAGRAAAVAAVLERCGGVLDGLVLCAGLGAHVEPPSLVVSVNYFGVTELLDGLLPALQRGRDAAAVVVSSVASTQLPWARNPLAAALERGDEAGAGAIACQAGARGGHLAYAGSKNAVTVAVRRRAASWGAAGVRLNTVAPGAVATPLLRAGLDDPRFGQAIRDFVAPIARHARPEEIAAMILFLLGPDAGFIHGAQMVVDGGVDALTRPTEF